MSSSLIAPAKTNPAPSLCHDHLDILFPELENGGMEMASSGNMEAYLLKAPKPSNASSESEGSGDLGLCNYRLVMNHEQENISKSLAWDCWGNIDW